MIVTIQADFTLMNILIEEGNAGNIYPLRKVRFGTLTELELSRQMKINNVYKYNFAGVRQTQSNVLNICFPDDDGTEKSAVYKWKVPGVMQMVM